MRRAVKQVAIVKKRRENLRLGYRIQSSLRMTPGGTGSMWARWDRLACPRRLTAAWAGERRSSLG